MEYLKDLLIRKALKEEVFRIDEFEKIIRVLVEYYNLSANIDSIIVTNFERYRISSNICALYYDRKLYFDHLRTVHSNPKVRSIIGDKKSITYFINLNIIKIILHELMHVQQEKKIIEEFTDIESYVLYVAYLRKKELIERGKYDEYYSVNPIERQAEIKALQKILEISRKNITGPNYFKQELDNTLLQGYSEKNPILINPCNIYFDNDLNFLKINNVSYEKKLELGLPVKKLKI